MMHVRVRPTKTLTKTETTNLNENCHAETCTSADVKKKRIIVKKSSKIKQTTCNWIKRTLNETT